MNADWLYEQYFGEYGLPDEFKPMVIDEVKRIANGFALSFALNRDVDTEIAEFQTTMKMLQMSGQFNQMVISLEQKLYDHTYDVNTSTLVDDNETVSTDVINKDVPSEWDRHVALHPEILENHELQYEEEQKETVKKYNLPYALEGKYPKYISLGHNMKRWFRPIKPKPEPKTHTSNIRSWHFEPGMFLYKPGGVGHVAMVTKYQHCGVGKTSSWLTGLVEAMPKTGIKGIQGYDFKLQEWQDRYDNVQSYAYKDGNNFDGGISSIPPSVRNNLANCARGEIGKRYNWNFFNPNSPDSSYCSQLVWKCYKTGFLYSRGNGYGVFKVDLDYNGGPIVFPRDLVAHHRTRIVNISTKR